MCLDRISERKVATEDIVCYKYIREQMVLKNKLKHGDLLERSRESTVEEKSV